MSGAIFRYGPPHVDAHNFTVNEETGTCRHRKWKLVNLSPFLGGHNFQVVSRIRHLALNQFYTRREREEEGGGRGEGRGQRANDSL